MRIYITLDYELFFGPKSGSVEKCIIEPTEKLLQIVDPFGIKFTCFVDSGYLLALKRHKDEHPTLQEDYEKITDQIKKLSNQGHGIELHVHPHWEDSFYDGQNWQFDTARYRLHDFDKRKVLDIVTRYTKVLEEIAGKPPVAYRAGGWSAQPFAYIMDALAQNKVFTDSTAYPGGKYISKNQSFDFVSVPQYKTEYSFSDDLTVEDANGRFTEIPISSYKVAPFFYWKFVLLKLLKLDKHKALGNGSAIPMEKKNALKLLLTPSKSVVSIDGYKASLIEKAFKKYQSNVDDGGNFVLIGHPKAFTPYSLEKVSQFVKEAQEQHNFKTFQ